jgi:hypothetical protein
MEDGSFHTSDCESSDEQSDIFLGESESKDPSIEDDESTEEFEELVPQINDADQPESAKISGVDVKWKKDDVRTKPQVAFKSAVAYDNTASKFLRLGLLNKSSIQLFLIMLPLTFWLAVVKNSNDYALISNVNLNLKLYELLLWISILLIHSMRGSSRIEDLWSENEIYHCPIMLRIKMSYKRWLLIRKYLHVAPVAEQIMIDPYFKVRKMIDELLMNSRINSPISQQYSVDEMTVGYQGRTFLINRTPSKKVAKGFQCVALSTSDGYVIDMHFDRDLFELTHRNLSLTCNRVIRVCNSLKKNPLKIRYATIYMDNRFTHPVLFSVLLKENLLYATGTWRSNFGVPKLILISNSKKVIDVQNAKEAGLKLCYCVIDEVKVVGLSLYDNAPFYMLTTGDYSFDKLLGGTKNVSRYDIQHDYNKYMGGNDIADSLLVAYSSYVRSRKYWFRLFHFLLDLAVNQAYHIFRTCHKLRHPEMKSPFQHSKFLLEIISLLVDRALEMMNDAVEETPSKRQKKLKVDEEETHLGRLQPFGHFAESSEKRRCKLCALNDEDCRSVWYCPICNVNLCMNPTKNCFRDFHTSKSLPKK